MFDGKLSEIRTIEKRGGKPLTEKDKRVVMEFIDKYHKNIIEKWVKFFVLKKSVKSTNIKTKI